MNEDVRLRDKAANPTYGAAASLGSLQEHMMRAALFVFLLSQSFYAISACAESPPADQGPWWVGHVVTFFGVIVAASMIVYQLGRQHANETARQSEDFKGQLRLQIYQEFSDRLATASDAAGSAGMYAMTSHTHSVIFSKQVAQGISPTAVTDRALQLLDKNSAAASEACEVLRLVEKYYIVHPDLDIFRTALSSALHEVHVAFHALFNFMLRHFPVDATTPSGVEIQNIKSLNESELQQLQRLADTYQNAAMEIGCYLMDMRVELQTLLLGHLFPNTVPRRRPPDPSKKVISLDPAAVESLRQHFFNNTAWGKSVVQIQTEVHREFHGRT